MNGYGTEVRDDWLGVCPVAIWRPAWPMEWGQTFVRR